MANKYDHDQLDAVHNNSMYLPGREIYLHGAYSGAEEPGVDYRMATTFIKNFRFLERDTKSNILVHMHTIGGEWNDGMGIFDTIKLSPCPVAILIYAHGRSMSSVIPQAADLRVMMPNSDFMIHYGSISLEDVSPAAKSSIDWNEKANKKMLEIYASRCVYGEYFAERDMSERQVMTFLDRKMQKHSDWWMTAEEAVFYGFADGILGEKGFESLDKIRKVKKFKG